MFHALVAVKQVPDTTNIRIDPDTGNLVREGVPAIMNPYDAHALASAVEWKRKLNGKVTVVSMGPPNFTTTKQKASRKTWLTRSNPARTRIESTW